MANPSNHPLFEDMHKKVEDTDRQGVSSDEPQVVDEIESLCMNCHEQGMTRLLLTKIPFFREVVIMSFACSHCAFRDTEVQPAGEIQQNGRKFTFMVEKADDLNRQLVKSDTCMFRVEDVDLEIPPGRGQLTNVEGILSMVAQDLEQGQPERKTDDSDVFAKIEDIINKLKRMASGESLPFTIVVDDPAGNSWIEPSTSDRRGQYVRADYQRTKAQNTSLGLVATDGTADDVQMRPEYHSTELYPQTNAQSTAPNIDAVDDDDIIENQVYSFPASCPGCSNSCATNMKMVNIPFFKQVIIMSTVCDHCGYRSNEVKTGGEVPDKGRRITVFIEKPEDLSRDILKSESCSLECPELALQIEPGTMGGRFTTVEGLLTQVRSDLRASLFDTGDGGDSVEDGERGRWKVFFDKLDAAISGEVVFHIKLEDPLAASYVQSFKAPEPDPQMEVEDYVRTEEEEDDLGLKDMNTENYQAPEELTEQEKAKQFLDSVARG